MANQPNNSVRGALAVVGALIYAVSGLVGVILAWVVIRRLRAEDYSGALAHGLALLALALLAALWFALSSLLAGAMDSAEEIARLHRTTRAASDRQAQLLADVVERLDGLTHWTAMGEATRSLLVRPRELSVLLERIDWALGEGAWAEAERLAAVLRDEFNEPARAKEIHEKMMSAREMADDRVVRGRISEVRALIDQQNFPAAELALGRVAEEFPSDKRLDDLRSTFTRARRRYSETARERFAQLLAERKMEDASTLLDELTWLDGDSAVAMREQWKEIFRQAQHEARDAFSVAVKDHQWARAVEHGEVILQRFGDSALAGEVRRLIDTLRQRAREGAAQQEAVRAAPPAPPGPPPPAEPGR